MKLTIYRYSAAPPWVRELAERSIQEQGAKLPNWFVEWPEDERGAPKSRFLGQRALQWAVVKSGWPSDWCDKEASDDIPYFLINKFQHKSDGLQWDEKVLTRHEIVTFIAYE